MFCSSHFPEIHHVGIFREYVLFLGVPQAISRYLDPWKYEKNGVKCQIFDGYLKGPGRWRGPKFWGSVLYFCTKEWELRIQNLALGLHLDPVILLNWLIFDAFSLSSSGVDVFIGYFLDLNLFLEHAHCMCPFLETMGGSSGAAKGRLDHVWVWSRISCW